MEKRDKRVVGAAAAAAIIIAIAILAVGWFAASRDDDAAQAGDPAPGATSTANAESDGRAVDPATGQAQPSPGQSSPGQSSPDQSSPDQSSPDQAQPSPGQPSQTSPSQAADASSADASTGASGPGQPATGAATGNLLASPATDGAVTGSNSSASSSSSSSTPADPAGSQTARQTAPQTTAQADPQAAPQVSGATDASPSGRTILTDEQVAVLPPIMSPSFDVVRVNELGDAVIAGRAEPRSVVIIYDGDREIGRVAADSRGEWVYVSDRPLVPGQHEIGLLSQSGPQSRLSDQIVVLIAPEPRQDIAGQPSEGNPDREKPLALLVPRDEIGATTVLQSPPAVATGRATESPAAGVSGPAIASSGSTAAVQSSDPGTSATTASGEAPVSIDVVDYDEAGRLIVSGRSTPQSDVRLYLDNEYVGTARTGNDGSFQVQPAEPVEPGVYALRVDEVSPVGSVTARAETPFQRAREVPEALPGHSRIVVQPGNSLWRIARQVYGQGVQYTVIYQANTGQIRNPDLIYPGQIFNVPEMPTEVPAGDPS